MVLTIVEQIDKMMPTIKHVLFFSSDLRQILSQITNVPPHIQIKQFSGHNTNTNHYNARQNYYQNTMLSILANHRYGYWKDCQSHVRQLLEPSRPKSNRNIDHLQPISSSADIQQRNFLIHVHGPMQATTFDHVNCVVLVYSSHSKLKSWIPDATTNKHSYFQK